MNTAAAAEHVFRAIEMLRNAKGGLNRVIYLAGAARSCAREAGSDIERAQLELKLALQELQRTQTGGDPKAA